jgi:4-hydroxy-4-methyl-2-oxoglutarate aldolase
MSSVSSYERVDAELARQASLLDTATLHEAAGKSGALPSAIKPMHCDFRLAGPALTVAGPPADNLWLHRAIAAAQPGDILVVFVSSFYEAGYWGEVMTAAARHRAVGGLVIDGQVRDVRQLAGMGFPIFARGACIRGTGKDFGASGALAQPILIGDCVIHSGDLIVGDQDGVVAIPRARAAEVVAAAHQRVQAEQEMLRQIARGKSTLELLNLDRS